MEDKIKKMKELVESMEEYENSSFFHFEEEAEIYNCDKEELFELIKSL